MNNNEFIVLKKTDLAKFMSMCGQTIISVTMNRPLTKIAMEASYKSHMEGTFMEDTISGIGQDYDNFSGELDINDRLDSIIS